MRATADPGHGRRDGPTGTFTDRNGAVPWWPPPPANPAREAVPRPRPVRPVCRSSTGQASTGSSSSHGNQVPIRRHVPLAVYTPASAVGGQMIMLDSGFDLQEQAVGR